MRKSKIKILKASTKYFHCHLSTNPDSYLELVKMKDISFDNFKITKDWQIRDERIKTKELYVKIIKELYVKNVLNYENAKKIKSQKYFKEDYRKALDFINSKHNQTRINVDSSLVNLVFDNQKPNLVLTLKKQINDIDDTKLLLDEMKKICLDLGLFDSSTKKGCHVCVDFRKRKLINNTGYIAFSVDEYCKIVPYPREFLNNFETIQPYYLLT
jgi:hypothetical protein